MTSHSTLHIRFYILANKNTPKTQTKHVCLGLAPAKILWNRIKPAFTFFDWLNSSYQSQSVRWIKLLWEKLGCRGKVSRQTPCPSPPPKSRERNTQCTCLCSVGWGCCVLQARFVSTCLLVPVAAKQIFSLWRSVTPKSVFQKIVATAGMLKCCYTLLVNSHQKKCAEAWTNINLSLCFNDRSVYVRRNICRY